MFSISVFLSVWTTTIASLSVLTINGSKTKYMINIKEKVDEPEETEINWQRYENVEMFKHLCSLVTNRDEVETEINVRIIAGNKYYNALGNLLKKRYVMHSLSIDLYKTVIRHIVTYDAESLEWLVKEE